VRPPSSIERLAPAKVNLALHVTGRRADGYHLLDSLIAFPGLGDTLTATAADDYALTIDGLFGEGLGAGPDNLVTRAATALATATGRPLAATLHLSKDLPIASGIGGGSADAAAALIALNDLWGTGLDRAALAALAHPLGADVPMCVHGVPLRARGIGDEIDRAPAWPDGAAIVLANPGVPVATPDVFRALTVRDSPPLPPLPDAWEDMAHLVDWLSGTRNDLSAPAIRVAPVIAETLEALRRTPGCRLARMSGSGATCFALYDDEERAARAASLLSGHPTAAWVASGPL
jgi:4-diphosphocytidyl-2-C-methyl-D-erythritol kinase